MLTMGPSTQAGRGESGLFLTLMGQGCWERPETHPRNRWEWSALRPQAGSRGEPLRLCGCPEGCAKEGLCEFKVTEGLVLA